jgi:hypothetical protein
MRESNDGWTPLARLYPPMVLARAHQSGPGFAI